MFLLESPEHYEGESPKTIFSSVSINFLLNCCEEIDSRIVVKWYVRSV